MLPLAQAVALAGHAPAFLVPNPEEIASVLEATRFPLGRVPPLPSAVPGSPARTVAATFADILGAAGIGDADGLAMTLDAWDRLLDGLGPALVVCEFSPLLCLAARGSRFPVVAVGHGFVLPPSHLSEFPLLAPVTPSFSQGELLEVVNRVQRQRRRPELVRLPAMMDATARFMTGLPELDPYRADRHDPVAGPPDTGVRQVWSEPVEDFFAYLSATNPITPRLLQALARSGLRGSVYVRGASPGLSTHLRGSDIVWLDRAASMPQRLERATMVVHHGSMLTSEEALIAGRHQVVAPIYLEHLLTARTLLEHELAVVIAGAETSEEMIDQLRSAVASPSLKAAARRFARDHHERAAQPHSSAPLDTILKLMASR
jgi:rhamnosyltransferase subunit B